MKLGHLLKRTRPLEKIHWDPHRQIRKITSDSRLVEAGDFFVACPGSRMDGHDFLGQAVLAKAAAIAFEYTPGIVIPSHVSAFRVDSAPAFLAEALNAYYNFPDQEVGLTGVTGTNGKTTITYLLHQLLREEDAAAYLGTLWYDLHSSKSPSYNTTPGSEVLIPLLDQMRRESIKHCVMEISSHALSQRRTHALQFQLAIFLQLTQDHLDYHKNMESYFQTKRLLFSSEPFPRRALINQDCPYGQRLLKEMPHAKSFSLNQEADYFAKEVVSSFQGSHFKFCFKEREVPIQIRLPMAHNVSNVVSVLAALDILGYDPARFREHLAEIPGIPGRLERISNPHGFQVFVDYAHTPDAIKNVLSAARNLKPKRILTLFGCGGDRDREKRPLMAEAACHYSDILVLTSDNPRSEDPEMIARDIRKGIPRNGNNVKVFEILDRGEAIKQVLDLAEPDDVVFLLGKGHEDTQILGDKKLPFDDRLVAKECLQRKDGVFFS